MIKSKPEDMWQCQMTNCGYFTIRPEEIKRAKIPPEPV